MFSFVVWGGGVGCGASWTHVYGQGVPMDTPACPRILFCLSFGASRAPFGSPSGAFVMLLGDLCPQ